MKVSQKKKDQLLKLLITSDFSTYADENQNVNYKITNINRLQRECSFIPQDNFISYLNMLEWENLIDIDLSESGQPSSIYLLPAAFSRYAAIKSENMYKHITLIFAVISTICAIIQVIDLFLQAQG